MTSNLERNAAALAADSGDARAFAALEEEYFLAADWEKLVALYRQRLEDPQLEGDERSSFHCRLGQILEERCLDIDLAIAEYTAAIRLRPTDRLALRQLRQVHARREAWDLVLQIAELEIETLHEPYERAVFFAEMGDVWLRRIHDNNEAMTCFEQALAIDPRQKEALAGLARTLEAQGNVEAAAATWERLIGCVRGPDRAAPLVALASLLSGPLNQGERAVELYRRALSDDPRNEAAVEALSVSAGARGQWELLGDLFERRFRLAAGARRRTAIALEAGYMQLERLDNHEAARIWFERAREMSGEDVTVLTAFIDLERKADDAASLVAAIDQLVRAVGGAAPLGLLLEAASLHTDRGDDEKALAHLELAARKCPEDPLVLEGLATTYSNLLRPDDLAAVLERRAALCPDDPEAQAGAFAELGHVQATQLEDLAAAQDAYERAFAAMPSMPGVASALEGLYRKTESFDALRKLLERATEAAPPSERCGYYCSLGELLEEHFSQPDDSAACFEAALQLRPKTTRALRGLARLAERSGDSGAMIRALEREADVCGDEQRLGEIAYELASRHGAHDDLETALTWAERALGTAPRERRYLEGLAALQERLGRDDDLTRTLIRLEDVIDDVEHAAVRRRIAGLLERSGNGERALSYWEAALESEPDDLESLAALRRYYSDLNRSEDLAPVLRKLAERSPESEQTGYLDELARLLDEQLCDFDGAIVVLWRLANLPDRPEGVRARLEGLLERAGRFEELAQQLLESRRGLPADSPEAIDLELRRAALLLDPLGRFEEAAHAFREVRRRAPDRSEATAGLERALRADGDAIGLSGLLGEMAEAASDPERRDRLHFERAVLLEESLGELEQARQVYTALCTDETTAGVAEQAGSRLESLLERCGNWTCLRERLEHALARAADADQRALHERIASLCADRLGDQQGCALHLEAAGRLEPERPEPWRRLATLYQELDRPDDLLRVTEAELASGPDAERERVLHARAAALWVARPGEDERACEHYERLLELEPGRSDATGFLVARYEAANRFADVVRLLEDRLAAVSSEQATAPGEDEDPDRGLQTSLRLRIAALRAGELADPEGAIRMLEPALADGGPSGPAAQPLADLYTHTGANERLIRLCEEAAASCEPGAERARWQLRLAGCLRAEGDVAGAALAYREVLDQHPHDEDAYAALCDLYRQEGQAGPLAELLEASLGRASQADEVAIRMELAALCEERLSNPTAAFAHLRRVIGIEGDHEGAFERSLRLAGSLQRHEEQLELIDRRLELRLSAAQRIDLLERRADLLAGPIGAPEAAVGAYREVIALDPTRRSARASLRDVLEALGRWSAVLDCLYLDADSAEPDEKAAIYESAVEVATVHVGQDAALPWLERLRAVRPQDPLVVARIADVHRRAGRFESVLRAIEDELALTTDPARLRDLHLGRARILERDMQAPGRAISALEAAHELDPQHPEILRRLDELYDVAGRARERVAIVEARIEIGEAPLELHLTAARLYSEALAEPAQAIPHLLRAVLLTRVLQGGVDSGPVSTPAARAALLAELGSTLRAAGREEAWARAAEAELRVLQADLRDHPAESAAPDSRPERSDELRRNLAWSYANDLADHGGALRHMRALIDAWPRGGPRRDDLERIEQRYLDLLRGDANWVELESRLAGRLARGTESLEEWLELARLRDERLHAPRAALAAYERALALRPSSLGAIRGLRDLAERLADWPAAARSLELELALQGRWSPRERGALSRRLGEIAWHRLGDPERAENAYRAALDADPNDLDALRALEHLHETRGSWASAAELYEREAELLGDEEPERCKQAWLLFADISQRHLADPRRALRGYEQAAEISPLALADRLARAELYQSLGEMARFAEVYASWCDDPGAGASCDEHLALMEVLSDLGRADDALARARIAVEIDDRHPAAWSALARLLRDRGRLCEAADAWETAGELRVGREAALDLQEAALLVEESDREACIRRLRRAVERDAGSLLARAHLARVAAALGRFEEAEEAAGRALDLEAGDEETALGDDLRLATALVGGRAARTRDRIEAAILFYGAALDLAPENTEALEARGALLFERGDLAAAREALEARIEQGADAGHAERLAMLGSVLELAGETDAAIERFTDAVAADALCGAGHAGLARLAQKAGRIDEAIAALVGWAEAARADDDRVSCGARLLRAAEIEMGHDRLDAAESHLQQALQADPQNVRAWVLRAEILADADRIDDLLGMVPEALSQEAVLGVADGVARLSLLYARALEQRGEAASACEAYAEAQGHDSRCAEAALARARLLRGRGEWNEAATVLRDFCDEHPEPDHRSLADAQYKLARLLSGPLEDMEGAIRCFTRALEIAPDHPKARRPLASLLAVLPDRWDEAIVHHAAILDVDPASSVSYRALLEIARGRGQEEVVRFGLAVLRALGTASPGERAEAATCLPRPIVTTPALEDPIGEIARRLVQHAAEALEQVLPGDPDGPGPHDFGARLQAAEREVCAVGLERLSDAEVRGLLEALATLALGDDTDQPAAESGLDADLLRGLERTLGRWSRRKMRRVLDGTTLHQIRAIDPERWRSEVWGLAAAVAVDLAHGDLRQGLAWLCRDVGAPEAIGDNDDLTARINGCPPARELLRFVAAGWCQELARPDRPRRA